MSSDAVEGLRGGGFWGLGRVVYHSVDAWKNSTIT